MLSLNDQFRPWMILAGYPLRSGFGCTHTSRVFEDIAAWQKIYKGTAQTNDEQTR
jgi:peroxiredoxin